MMTEDRAIYLLKSILPKKVSFAQMICASNCYGDEMVYEDPEPYAIEYAINSIQENAKLKTEIEQLKESRNYISEVNGSLVRINDKQDREITKLKDENEQLKAELEQWQSTNLELVCELTRIECENNQLKSELEQSAKFPLTNADKIRSMSDEELAEFIQDVQCDNHGYFVDKLLSKSANPICILEMLKSEVPE